MYRLMIMEWEWEGWKEWGTLYLREWDPCFMLTYFLVSLLHFCVLWVCDGSIQVTFYVFNRTYLSLLSILFLLFLKKKCYLQNFKYKYKFKILNENSILSFIFQNKLYAFKHNLNLVRIFIFTCTASSPL